MNASRRILAVGAMVVITASCSSGSSAPSDSTVNLSTALTLEQAEVLSGILFKNFEAGGATFKVTVPYGPAATFVLDGRIDFTRHIGEANLLGTTTSADKIENSSSRLFWTPQDVVEEMDGLPAAMAAKGRSGVKYLARPLTKTSPQDVVLGFILATSSEQRENPQLIQQGDARFLRQDTVDGQPVDVYRFGTRTTYFVRRDNNVLTKIEAQLAVAQGVTVVDFMSHGPVEITGPLQDEVVQSSEIPDVLAKLTGSSPPTTTG